MPCTGYAQLDQRSSQTTLDIGTIPKIIYSWIYFLLINQPNKPPLKNIINE